MKFNLVPLAVISLFSGVLLSDSNNIFTPAQQIVAATVERLPSGYNSCESLLTSKSFRLSDEGRPVRKVPTPVYNPGPRPSDLEIPQEILDFIEQFKHGNNYSRIYLGLKPLLKNEDEAVCSQAAAKITSRIAESGQLAQKGKLNEAIALLNDETLLNGTKFFWSRLREPIRPDAIYGQIERTYSHQLVRSFRLPPSVSFNGRVTIPHPPIEAGSSIQIYWAKREWLRIAGEELGHVAQMLNTHVNPDGTYISQMFKAEGTAVRSLVALESAEINAKEKENYKMQIHYEVEADIYAFLIESFGVEFYPAWVGIDSGYGVRHIVDEELTRRGESNRNWQDWSKDPRQNAATNP